MSVETPLGFIAHYYDYYELAFTAVPGAYVVGAAALTAMASGWPTGLAARRIYLRASEDCYVRFVTPTTGGAASVPVVIYRNLNYSFPLAVLALYATRVTDDGTLRIVMMA